MSISTLEQSRRLMQGTLLGGLLLVIGGVGYSLIRYPALLTIPESGFYLIPLVILLGSYGWAAFRGTQASTDSARLALQFGWRWGILVGALWMIELWAGNLADPSGNSVVRLIYHGSILAVPLITVWASASASRLTGKILTGVRVGLWSGLISALITFATFMVIAYFLWNVPPNAHEMSDFARSGISDFAVYRTADNMAAMINHLWIGPFVGLIAGTVGGVLGSGITASEGSRAQ